MKQLFFLAGLPRSLSTGLGSILSQNPSITVTPTSPLLDLLCYTNEAFNRLNEKYTYDSKTVSSNVYKGIVESFFENIPTPIVIDKHRGHPRNVNPLKMFVTPNPKIICTVRPIPEVISSYIKLIEKNKQDDNFVDNSLRNKRIPVNISNRAKCLWEEYISDPYQSMIHGIKNHREHLHIVEYNELVNNPTNALKDIYKFLELPFYEGHQFNNIHNHCAEEKDAAWGLENLHKIRPKLEKTSTPPEEILGPFLTDYYTQFNLVY
jgi:sulfotransferase